MIEPVKEVTISRALWGRGETGGKLCDRNRKNRCCLSFVANQLYGIPINDMRCVEMPHLVLVGGEGLTNEHCPLLISPKYGGVTQLAADAADINDDKFIMDDTRERRIVERFKAEGVKITFVD